MSVPEQTAAAVADTTGLDIGTQAAPTLDQYSEALHPADTPEAVDFATFERARITEARGKPADPATPAPVAEKPAPDDVEDAAGTGPKYGDQIAPHIKRPKPAGVSKAEHVRSELVARIAERDQELAQLRTGRTTPQPVAAPAATPAPPADGAQPDAKWDGSIPDDPAPTIDQFADADDPYKAHIKAELKWEQRKEQRVAQFTEHQTRAATEAQALQAAYVERATAYHAAHPEWVEKTAAIRNRVDPNTPLGRDLMDSPVSPQLLDYFAEHPEEFDRIARSGPRAFGKLEALFDAPKGETATKPAPVAAATPGQKPIKTTSSAPPPGPALGARPAEPANRVTAAVASSDFAAFEHEAIMQARASRSGGQR